MKILLKFDIVSYTVYIPDGYVHDTKQLEKDFLDWLEDHPAYCSAPGQRGGMCYDGDTFLLYLNEVLLADSRERAYFVDQQNKKLPIISF